MTHVLASKNWHYAIAIKPVHGGWLVEKDNMHYAIATSIEDALEIVRDLLTSGIYEPFGVVHRGAGDVVQAATENLDA